MEPIIAQSVFINAEGHRQCGDIVVTPDTLAVTEDDYLRAADELGRMPWLGYPESAISRQREVVQRYQAYRNLERAIMSAPIQEVRR